MYHRISSQQKVICYLQFNTCNWTGDQQSTVSENNQDSEYLSGHTPSWPLHRLCLHWPWIQTHCIHPFLNVLTW